MNRTLVGSKGSLLFTPLKSRVGWLEYEDGAVMTEETMRGTQEEPIVLPLGAVSTIAGETVAVKLRALDDGSVRVEFDGPAGCVLLRITEAIELYDGDLVCAGRQWLSFQAGRDGRPGRLHVLDGDGGIHLGFTLRGTALSLGREVGDVVLPWDDSLAELHLQVLMRREGTFLQDLASAGGTWVVVQAGEVLPSGSIMAIGERLLRVSTPSDGSEVTTVDRAWTTEVYVAA
jgi:hypothetical protein